ncbi:hypothetical protein GOBAR_AA02106 [Gossypium barbadense]|uniref:No apical meristem-associated C-terminal domain-containing protein n=1 Tax=Gossypium barbadense TaxID=3634 RepID=A0A2P5SS21_GOSBA|nr:hypothetical protein GOBAR_DD01074 [Gossypium barbadense]PPS18472.1 hypothetical protein GOBAR_AA02106 [Gossypium barbadense]
MECSRDKGFFNDQSRAGSKFHGDQKEQAALGSYLHQDEGKRVIIEALNSASASGKTSLLGCGTVDAEIVRQQFPFYDELQAIFTARMQSVLCSESEGGGATGSKKKAAQAQLSSDEEDDTEENEYSFRKKKKGKTGGGSSSTSGSINIKEMLANFMRQQLQMEMQWREALESRENERRMKEMEWRQTMEALENERIMMERRWREREEQRRIREEARAEKRDALITALLNKLRREDQM